MLSWNRPSDDLLECRNFHDFELFPTNFPNVRFGEIFPRIDIFWFYCFLLFSFKIFIITKTVERRNIQIQIKHQRHTALRYIIKTLNKL